MLVLREGSEVRAPLPQPPPSVAHSATSTHGGGRARTKTGQGGGRGGTQGSEGALERFSVSRSDLPATRSAVERGSVELAGAAEASLVTSLGTFCFAALGRIDLCVQVKTKEKKDEIGYKVTTG